MKPKSTRRAKTKALDAITHSPRMSKPRIAVFRERDLVHFAYSGNQSPHLRLDPRLPIFRKFPELQEELRARYVRQRPITVDEHPLLSMLQFELGFSCGRLSDSEITPEQLAKVLSEERRLVSDPQYQRKLELEKEVLRLMRYAICPYCKTRMKKVPHFGRKVLLCPKCGYWGGRGEREDESDCPPVLNGRGVLGRVCHFDLDSAHLQFKELVGHLRRIPDHLLKLSPRRAEQVVMDLLREVLDCEVRHVGGPKDGGADGYVVRGDGFKTLVQVKWHYQTKRAESVKLVREIVGTLLLRGVPSGLLVTTSERISREAKSEIDKLSDIEVIGQGALQLNIKTYNDIVDMLGLAWQKLGSSFESAIPWLSSEPLRSKIFD